MTDNNQATQQISPEQDQIIRNHIHLGVIKEYLKFIEVLRKLPFQQQNLVQAFTFLDTGMLWLKEAIYYSPFVNPQIPPQAPSTPSASVEEAKTPNEAVTADSSLA